MKKRVLAALLIVCVFAMNGMALAESWTCLNCGQENNGNFCTECGAKKGTWICPGCGKTNESNFCSECGTKRPSAPQQASSAPAATPSPGDGGEIESGFLNGSIKWTLTEDGLLTVTGKGELTYKSLTDSPFANDKRIRAVYIGEGITAVDNAFYGCNKMEAAVLPSTIERIGSTSFMYCTKLREINFPEGLTSIGYKALEGAGITEAYLPETLESIGDDAFLGCDELKSVYIPGGVKSLPQGAFYGCDSLEEVVFGDGVERVGGFSKCPMIREIVLPASVTSVEAYAFNDNTALESVEIMGDDLRLNSMCFAGCESLKEIRFSGMVSYLNIDGNAFKDSPVSTFIGNPGTEIEKYAANWSWITFKPIEGAAANNKDDSVSSLDDAIGRMNCFERMRTELQGWLGVMDVYGKGVKGFSNNTCVCIFDMTLCAVTLTGIGADGQWHNAIWYTEEEETAIALVMAADEFEFFSGGLGDNSSLLYAIKYDDDMFYIEDAETAESFAQSMLSNK